MLSLVIHGGAGSVHPGLYSEDEIKSYEIALQKVLDIGFRVLEQKGSAIDAVTAAVCELEDVPLFNAGRGSVLCADGRIQMDAAIMCGESEGCGGVTLVESIQNPILAARLVMEKTPHRLFGGKDAELLAQKYDLAMKPFDYFCTEKRAEQLKDAQKRNSIELDHDGDSHTVGAVAVDINGNVAAATSTGGMTNKKPGRVSDTSIVGAGTYANNKSLAISCTGTGDVFIQNVSSFDAHALIHYKGMDLDSACQVVLDKVKEKGGNGGLIAVNSQGQHFMGFNSGGMFRGVRNSNGQNSYAIF